jgi:hypothetical protein
MHEVEKSRKILCIDVLDAFSWGLKASLKLGRLSWRPRDTKINIFCIKNRHSFLSCKILQILDIKNPGSGTESGIGFASTLT